MARHEVDPEEVDGVGADQADVRRRLLRRYVYAPLTVLIVLLVVSAAITAWIAVPNLYPVTYSPPDRPEVSAAREATRSQAIVTTRASVLAALAGAGALVTIFINYRNSRTAAATLATTNETFRVTERSHFTERYTKAIEQLGEVDSAAVRLGGIYALEQLAVDSPREGDQSTVVEVLSAFVRLAHDRGVQYGAANRTKEISLRPEIDREKRPVAFDVNAALSVLGRLPTRSRKAIRADLSYVDLSDVTLVDADFSRARFLGSQLLGAYLDGCIFSGATFAAADIRGVRLRRARLRGAQFVQTTMHYAQLQESGMQNANLRGADLRNANLSGANLESADFTGADLSGASLRNSQCAFAKFDSSNVSGADFTNASVREANFADARGLESAGLTYVGGRGPYVRHIRPFARDVRGS